MYTASLVFEALNYASMATRNMLSQFYDSIGFSSVETGYIMACLPLIAMISNPFWFRISIKISERKTFIIISLSSSVLFISLFFSHSFLLSIVSVCLFSFFYSSCVPIGDSFMMNYIKKHGGSFDKIRLFGTIGYSVTSLILSKLVQNGFIWYFIVASVCLILSTMIVLFKKRSKRKTGSRAKIICPRNGDKATFIILTVGFFFGVFIGSFHITFLPFLTKEIGLDNSSIGIIFAIMSISEAPFLLFADKIISKFGNIKIFLFGLFVVSLRNLIIIYANSLISILLIEILQGFTYILMYYSLFNYIHFKLPKKYLVKAQSIFWASSMGLACIFSSVFGGYLIKWVKVKHSYVIIGIIGFLVLIVLSLIFLKRKNTYKRINIFRQGSKI